MAPLGSVQVLLAAHHNLAEDLLDGAVFHQAKKVKVEVLVRIFSADPKQVGERIFIVNVEGYACIVPFIETDNSIFLKTIIPSRKMTRLYLGGGQE